MKIFYVGPPIKEPNDVVAWIEGLIESGRIESGEFRLKWRITASGERTPYLDIPDPPSPDTAKRKTNPS